MKVSHSFVRSIIKFTGLTLLLLFVAYVGWMYSSPSEVKVEDYIYIDASASHTKEFLSDFRNWESWNNLKLQDPTVSLKTTDQKKGIGAAISWDSDLIGSGTIVNIRETEDRLFQKYRYKRPFGESEASVVWDFENISGRTKLRWRIEGKVPFFLRWTSTNLIASLSKESRVKLKQLKNQAELKDIQNLGIRISVVNRSPRYNFVYIKGSTSLVDAPKNLSEMFSKVANYGLENRFPYRGKPFTIYTNWSPNLNDQVSVNACIPVGKRVRVSSKSQFRYGEISSGKALKVVFDGSYDRLTKVHKIINSYIKQNNIETKGNLLEFYSVNLAANDTRFFTTEIYVPIY